MPAYRIAYEYHHNPLGKSRYAPHKYCPPFSTDDSFPLVVWVSDNTNNPFRANIGMAIRSIYTMSSSFGQCLIFPSQALVFFLVGIVGVARTHNKQAGLRRRVRVNPQVLRRVRAGEAAPPGGEVLFSVLFT